MDCAIGTEVGLELGKLEAEAETTGGCDEEKSFHVIGPSFGDGDAMVLVVGKPLEEVLAPWPGNSLDVKSVGFELCEACDAK